MSPNELLSSTKATARRRPPPPCRICQRTFTRQEHLQRHLRTHTKEKPYPCHACGKSFGRRDLLARHKKLLHSETGDRPRSSPTGGTGTLESSASWQHHLSSNQPQEGSMLLDSEDLTGDPWQDFNLFLENIGLSQDWDPLSAFSTSQDGLDVALPMPDVPDTELQQAGSGSEHQEEVPFSTFGSRLPSLQPQGDESTQTGTGRRATIATNLRSRFDTGKSEYASLVRRLQDLSGALPDTFTAPSRYALIRFLDGYVEGLSEHQPFIHVPTLSIVNSHPALILALAACGSHYRFEREKGYRLFEASMALLHNVLKDSWSSPDCQPLNSGKGSVGTLSSGKQDREILVEMAQTALLLTIYVTWETGEADSQRVDYLRTTLNSLLRRHGLSEAFQPEDPAYISDHERWLSWVRRERDRRTKFVAYWFLNLHTLMHDSVPLMLHSDLGLLVPCCPSLWKASSVEEWLFLSAKDPSDGRTFQQSYSQLFRHTPSTSVSTPLENHALMHALSQNVYFARQLARSSTHVIGTENLAVLNAALGRWKLRWQATPESSTDPRNPAGPLAFTSAALLGQVYVRLHCDLGPQKGLSSQNPDQIARALYSAPPPVRTTDMVLALLHAAHALSVPVRLGIEYVSRSQSSQWSVFHSIVSLEYAFVLVQWLLMLPRVSSSNLSEHEVILLLWLRSMVDESGIAGFTTCTKHAALADASDEPTMRKLAVSVVRIWAKSFRGDAAWAIVGLVGQSLDVYADLLEQHPLPT